MKKLLPFLIALLCVTPAYPQDNELVQEMPRSDLPTLVTEPKHQEDTSRESTEDSTKSNAPSEPAVPITKADDVKQENPDRPGEALDKYNVTSRLTLQELSASLYPLTLQQKYYGATRELQEVYAGAAASPEITDSVVVHALQKYFDMRSNTKSAVQVSQAVDELSVRLTTLQVAQNRRIIEQNDLTLKQNEKIIELLTEIAKKK